MTIPTEQKEKTRLIRQLGLFDTTMIIISIVIGSGIFLTAGIIAKGIPFGFLILIAWLVGGLHALLGALTYAELGASMPQAGGQYVYLREAYGRFSGFLFGWVSFSIYLTGIIASLAVGCAEYMGYFFPFMGMENILFKKDFFVLDSYYQFSLSTGHLTAVIMILMLSLVNYRGVRISKYITNTSSLIKIGALLLFICFGLYADTSYPDNFHINIVTINWPQLLFSFGLALVAVSWSYAGWEEVSFVTGEVINPSRNLPRALIIGTISVTTLYLLINFIYLKALSIEEMSGIVRIGEAAAYFLWGPTGASLLSIAVIITILGALNSSILVGPRVFFAMAQDNLFFQKAATVHPKFKTPGHAVIFQAVWACILTLSGTFEDLITLVVFANLMLWIAGAAAVFTLRRKMPKLPRPYKVWGYPIVPLLFIIGSSFILVNMLFETPIQAITGLLLTSLGVPIYYFLFRLSK